MGVDVGVCLDDDVGARGEGLNGREGGQLVRGRSWGGEEVSSMY